MNIVNKFVESLGMPIVKYNIYRMCLFVFAPENQQSLVCRQICLLLGHSYVRMAVEKPDKHFQFYVAK